MYQPPFWVHAVLWLPLILIVTLGPLRPMKGLMIALQYHHKAAEGRLERRGGAMSRAMHGAAAVVARPSWCSAADRFAVLLGLGTWQLERKAWKEGLIATLTEPLAQPPVALPSPAAWRTSIPPPTNSAACASRRIRSRQGGAGVHRASAFRPDVSGPGYWVFSPARLADGNIVMVNRGFVPEGRQDAKTRPRGQITGPVDLWFSADPQAIAAAKEIGAVAPF